MSDRFTPSERSQIMAAVRSKGNKATELKFVSILRAHGIKGWRRHEDLPGRPDFTFRRERIALFIDGCFWHGCRWHCRMPKSNSAYWAHKIGGNKLRDRQTTKDLRKGGWRVLRFWEHSLRMGDQLAARLISELIKPPIACEDRLPIE